VELPEHRFQIAIACRVAWTLWTNGSTPGHSGLSSTTARTWSGSWRRYSRAILDVVPKAITFHRSIARAFRRSSASAAISCRSKADRSTSWETSRSWHAAIAARNSPRVRGSSTSAHRRRREGLDLRADQARLGPAGSADVQHDHLAAQSRGLRAEGHVIGCYPQVATQRQHRVLVGPVGARRDPHNEQPERPTLRVAMTGQDGERPA
jgi:hypothetical protein